MDIENFDLANMSKLTSFFDEFKCLECCKYFIAPATAACSHTLCHRCWMSRRTCPECATPLNRKAIKPNLYIQTLAHYVQQMGEAIERKFNINLDGMDLQPLTVESEIDCDKNVKNWLASSQNHFSAPLHNTEPFSQESQQLANPVELSSDNIIIHAETKKSVSPKKQQVCQVIPVQDDWDKIEPMPDEEERPKSKENIVGPMDIEPFFVDYVEFTAENPRRSLRKRDVKQTDSYEKTNKHSDNKLNTQEPNSDIDKKSEKSKQTWNNVKRMKKEFSKLNSKMNKLDVSTEMVNRKQNVKPISNTPVIMTQQIVNIDENTPNNNDKENQLLMLQPNNPIENINESVNCKTAKEIINADHHTKIIQHPNPNNIISNESSCHSEIDHEIIDKVMTKVPYIRKSVLAPKNVQVTNIECPTTSKESTNKDNCEDIHIAIKVRNIITKIIITNKNDVQVKTYTDQEIQTSLGPQNLNHTEIPTKQTIADSLNISKNNDGHSNTETQTVVATNRKTNFIHVKADQSTSEKKNTTSADTATAQFEITESVEKELLNEMEFESARGNNNVQKVSNNGTKVKRVGTKNVNNLGDWNDLDIFNSGSVKDTNVQALKEDATSEILISTLRSKLKTQRNTEKRVRDYSELSPKSKKVKITQEVIEKNTLTDSEPINYDIILGQVFANIDADIAKTQNTVVTKTTGKDNINQEIQLNNNDLIEIIKPVNQSNTQITTNLQEYFNEKDSENIFSNLGKFDENSLTDKHKKTSDQVDDLLTPVVCHNFESSQESHDGANNGSKSHKNLQDCDDSDRSVVEETPQKNVSVIKLKRASTINTSQHMLTDTKNIQNKMCTQSNKSIINLSDTLPEYSQSKVVTVIETIENAGKVQTLETPLTITKFVDEIMHKSTPVARKSLNFNNEKEDPEETIFTSTDAVAKTTQEKEFMRIAFEKTCEIPVARPLVAKNVLGVTRQYCLAGSCLTPNEIASVKTLATQYKWTYIDKYSKDLTHLVVGVDEQNKSQRSVKYMCALAASKWIVSYNWINSCLQNQRIMDEADFEALDSCGEPGPKRSRIAKQKLFQGIKFYCMPPFSVLNVETLKDMLSAAGGRIVDDMKQVTVSDNTSEPALLLAEPEHTQEDRFIYLAMEHRIVPVNYEWALNCLGNYILESIQDLLLCPSSLLPPITSKWPAQLLTQD